jgi:hypothetical protein
LWKTAGVTPPEPVEQKSVRVEAVWPTDLLVHAQPVNQTLLANSLNLNDGSLDELVYLALGHAAPPPGSIDPSTFVEGPDGSQVLPLPVKVSGIFTMSRGRIRELRDILDRYLTETDHDRAGD